MKAVQLRPAVFLDRDGTLIEDRGHLSSPAEVVFFPETAGALRKLQYSFLLFITTNQPGVAGGLIGIRDVERVNRHVVARLAEEGVIIKDCYVCPHKRTDNCSCIKPKPYFLRMAAEKYRIDLRRSFVVGDHPHDVELARNAGARGIYVRSGHGEKHLAELPANEVVVRGIREAADWILSHDESRNPENSHAGRSS